MVELETWITWGLTALAAAIGIVTIWLWWRQRKPEEPTPEPVPKADSRLVQLARDALEQRKKEHQWRQLVDVADRVLPIILSDDEDDEDDEEES